MENNMTREEEVAIKMNAEERRLQILKDYKSGDNTARELELLLTQLELVHETIKIASFNLDLMDLRAAVA